MSDITSLSEIPEAKRPFNRFNYFEREDYHSRYALRKDVYHDSLTDKISIHFIEARKCHRLSEKNQSRLMRWMDYLSDNTPVALM